METKANYVLIGAFTLVVLLAMVVFALWVAKFSSDSNWRDYDIVFKEPVSGLSIGSPAHYNGINVGSVRELSLAPDNPSEVIARIRLKANTPVREDTRASLSFVGLTGVAFIQLSGGSLDSPPLRGKDGEVPRIVAKTSSFQKLISSSEDVATAASQVLLRLSAMLNEDNAERVARTLDHIESLTSTLADERGELAASLRAVRAASERLPALLARGERALAHLEHAGEVIDASLIADLPQISRDLKATLAHLARASEQAEAVLGPRGAASDALGARGVGQAGPALAELRALLRELARLSRRLEQNPAAFLLGGDDRKEFTPP